MVWRACLLTMVACAWLACGEGFTSAEDATAGGGPTSCSVATDCNAPPTPCTRAECLGGECRYPNVESGRLPESLQVQGDCLELHCDGKGTVIDEHSSNDIPNDGNECTDDGCSGDQPQSSPVAAGRPCGYDGQLTCDGDGHCKGCNSPADCGAAGPCHQWECSGEGICNQHFAQEGTPIGEAGQTEGDCKLAVCDGSGGVTHTLDNADAPVLTCQLTSCNQGSVLQDDAPNNVPCGPQLTEVCCGGMCCATGYVCDTGDICVPM